MREKLKYFILNKAYDYKRGIFENMEVNGSMLCFRSDRQTGVGRFMTRIFDSTERDMTWHRLVIHTKDCSAEDMRVTVYASDKNELEYEGSTFTLYDFFEDESRSLDEKIKAFAPFAVRRESGSTDIFLHDVHGRYLWVLIEQYSAGSANAKIVDVRIFLPAASWIDYMPRIYRNSDGDTHFLERYLGIFQTIYEEIDSEIEDMAHRFDPESAESDFLKWLAGWLDIKDTGLWTEEQLRKLIMNAVRLYRMRGTKQALSDIIEIYTGEKPFIIEGFEIKDIAASLQGGKQLLEMYGGNPYMVTVLVKPGYDIEALRRIALEMLPITAELNLVELDPYVFLDNYTYLGVNSRLGYYRPAVLDGGSQLMMSVLGGSDNEQ